MTSTNWDKRFLALAEHVSGWSKDPSTKVGAVLVDSRKIVVGMGYNGFPRGVLDTDSRLNDRPTKYALVVHAEANAILAAGEKARGATMYVWCPDFPVPCSCADCCKLGIQAGIKAIVGGTTEETALAKRWAESAKLSKLMCDEAGVAYRTGQ